jgi:hypothetical protein
MNSEFHKSYGIRAKTKGKFRLDQICPCKNGSKPGWVSITPTDHLRSCEIRKRIARMSYEEGDLLNG